MITIRIDKGGLRVTGHAGRDSPDHSLICCAVSTLVQTLALAFPEYREKHATKRFRQYLHKQKAYRRKNLLKAYVHDAFS